MYDGAELSAGDGLYDAFSEGYPVAVCAAGGGPEGGAYCGSSPGLPHSISDTQTKSGERNVLRPLGLTRRLVHVEPGVVIRIILLDPSGEVLSEITTARVGICCLHVGW